MMKKIIYKDYSELSNKTAELINSILKAKKDALICFPAGETSVGTFKKLIDFYKDGELDFSNVKYVGLDEWAYLDEMQSENCQSFMKKHFLDHVNFKPENVCFFDGEAKDLQEQINITEAFIKKYGPIDIMLLGVGMNGHIGLNEPGIDFYQYSHIVELDEVTRKVGQKYFSKPVTLTKGITLGMNYFMEAKTVMLQLNGKRKAPVVKKLMESPINNSFPASLVREHQNSYVLMDVEAASEL